MRQISQRLGYWFNLLSEITPATTKQLNCLGEVELDASTSRDAMESLVGLGLVRKYKEPKRKQLPQLEAQLNVGRHTIRSCGRRPWVYEITPDGVAYLDHARECDKILRNLDLAKRQHAAG